MVRLATVASFVFGSSLFGLFSIIAVMSLISGPTPVRRFALRKPMLARDADLRRDLPTCAAPAHGRWNRVL